MLGKKQKPTLYSVQYCREQKKERIITDVIWCFSCLILFLLGCIFFSFIYFALV